MASISESKSEDEGSIPSTPALSKEEKLELEVRQLRQWLLSLHTMPIFLPNGRAKIYRICDLLYDAYLKK